MGNSIHGRERDRQVHHLVAGFEIFAGGFIHPFFYLLAGQRHCNITFP